MTSAGSIGERIRQLRTERMPRLTQRELAEKSGISVDLISKLEQGTKQSALLTTLTKIARALDVDVSASPSYYLRTGGWRAGHTGGVRTVSVSGMGSLLDPQIGRARRHAADTD